MNFFGHDLSVWFAIAGGTCIKLFTSPYQGILRAGITVMAAFFAPLVFAEPTVVWLSTWGASPDTTRIPVAVLWTLTGEGIMRLIIDVSKQPERLIELYKVWRGK